ncbi:MAG: Na+:solute symporter, partial [Bacteroidetes bacterium]|nr:Na+:solute symporter [Bacteroidota bacterium]
MILTSLDWIIIVFFLLLSLAIGIRFSGRAGKSITEFFLSGRSLPWYVAGISMVATTFAADTPLAVTELVGENGISGNWLWWNMLIGGMLTTFFFAKLWRRANILTEVEFIELRYSGVAASFLRGFKSVYLGLFMNVLIMGWVNLAFISILKVFFNLPEVYPIPFTLLGNEHIFHFRIEYYAAIAMLFVAFYSSLAGLWGVAINDLVQFVIAMTGSIVLAIFMLRAPEIGGISGLKAQLDPSALKFLPHISSAKEVGQVFSIGIGTFLAFIGVQWWASWYPGAEPGGGGYIAQRMMSAKNEKHSLFATLLFQIAHYCIRPWPWIIVALGAMVLYPDLGADDKKLGYVMAMKDFLPNGWRGLMLIAFVSAYMSTISTQLNWGSSYLVNDLYKRFINRKEGTRLVLVSRIITVVLSIIAIYATTRMDTIKGTWEFILECGAGLGLVLILRWYWWRINVWSEITATLAPFLFYFIFKLKLGIEFPNSFFLTVLFTTLSWIVVTYLTPPEKNKHLHAFYVRVKPEGFWNGIFTGEQSGQTHKSSLGRLFLSWGSAVVMTYSVLFASGKLIFREWKEFLFFFGVFVIAL